MVDYNLTYERRGSRRLIGFRETLEILHRDFKGNDGSSHTRCTGNCCPRRFGDDFVPFEFPEELRRIST